MQQGSKHGGRATRWMGATEQVPLKREQPLFPRAQTHWQSMHDWQSSIAADKLACASKNQAERSTRNEKETQSHKKK